VDPEPWFGKWAATREGYTCLSALCCISLLPSSLTPRRDSTHAWRRGCVLPKGYVLSPAPLHDPVIVFAWLQLPSATRTACLEKVHPICYGLPATPLAFTHPQQTKRYTRTWMKPRHGMRHPSLPSFLRKWNFDRLLRCAPLPKEASHTAGDGVRQHTSTQMSC
jgi:hypothetical protein